VNLITSSKDGVLNCLVLGRHALHVSSRRDTQLSTLTNIPSYFHARQVLKWNFHRDTNSSQLINSCAIYRESAIMVRFQFKSDN
jgi:hypothetical protein